MTNPMPSTWRRLPLATTEYEWFHVDDVPRAYRVFVVLVHHQRTHDVVCETILHRYGDSFDENKSAILRRIPQAAVGRGVTHVTLDALLRRFYLPPLFTTYGFDRKAIADALRKTLPVPLHHQAQRSMRQYLHEKQREVNTARARSNAVKKPTIYRDLARVAGRALYKLGALVDTWLWRGPR